MTTFLIILVAILVICCGIMLYLYFSVRKEADDNEGECEFWRREFDQMRAECNKTFNLADEIRKHADEIEKDNISLKKKVRQLQASFNDHTINIRTFGTRTNYFSGSIDIPVELRSAENNFDPFDAPIVDQDIQRKLVKILGEEVLKHTGFRMEYDMYGHKYSLIYICPMCVENKYVNDGEAEYLDKDAAMPMLDMIQKLFIKQEEKE